MNPPLPNLLINTRSDFDECYEYGSEIGKGRYATVKKCYCKKTQKCFAAKIIKNFRTKNNKLNLNIVENEITALTLSRSNSSIVNLYEVFYHRGETILILEYATEKDLHLYLDCEGAFEEEKACQIIYQVLKAIEFLHSKQILHLDIKPENVLLMNPLPGTVSSEKCEPEDVIHNSPNKLIDDEEEDLSKDLQTIEVKLCDFSFSQIMQPGKHILGMMGTVAYSAPEVLQYEPLTKATDMWSVGVLAHVLLTEYTPFGNGTEKNLQTETNILSVKEKEFKCVEEYFDNISLEAQDFIESLLKFRPKFRLTVEEALNHKWFKKFGIVSSSNDLGESSMGVVEKSSFKATNLNSSITSEKQQTVNLSLEEKQTLTISSCSITTNGDSSSPTKTTSTMKTSSSSTSSTVCKKQILTDDKNNNILSTLIESQSPDIKSSSTSSISSTSSNPKSTSDNHHHHHHNHHNHNNSSNHHSQNHNHHNHHHNGVDLIETYDNHHKILIEKISKFSIENGIDEETAVLPVAGSRTRGLEELSDCSRHASSQEDSAIANLASSTLLVTQLANKLAENSSNF